jgi:hypothetical protein
VLFVLLDPVHGFVKLWEVGAELPERVLSIEEMPYK